MTNLAKPAWAVFLTTAGLGAYIGVAAFNSTGGDRPAGALLCSLVAVAVIAMGLARHRTDVTARTLLVVAIAQVLAAAVMIARHWGTVPVISAINGILVTGWLVAAGLFYAATE